MDAGTLDTIQTVKVHRSHRSARKVWQVYWRIGVRFSTEAMRWHNAGIIETAARVEASMEHDEGKVDEMVLALLYLTTFKDGPNMRAWKGQDWAAMERLYKAGYIADPQNKAKSVRMTEEGLKKSRDLFERHFVRKA